MYLVILAKKNGNFTKGDLYDILDVCDENNVSAAIIHDEEFVDCNYKNVLWNKTALLNGNNYADNYSDEC